MHETLDRRPARPISKLHQLGDFALQIECEPVLRAPGNIMHMAANGPQEVFGFPEPVVLICCQQTNMHKFRRRRNFVDVFAYPIEGVQIPQATFSILNIGFNNIAAVSHALMTFVALCHLQSHKVGCGVCNDFFPEAHRCFFINAAVAPNKPAFKKRRADRQILLGHLHCFIERSA